MKKGTLNKNMKVSAWMKKIKSKEMSNLKSSKKKVLTNQRLLLWWV